MKRKLISFVLPVALLAAGAFAQTGAAAAPNNAATGSKIGIINIQEAIVKTNEGQRDFGALQKKFEPKQSELNNLNKEIQTLQDQLKAQGDKLNEEARTTLVNNISVKQKSLQREAEDAQQDFQAQQGEIANRIGGKLMEVLDKFAKQNGYAVVIDASSQQSPVLWAANGNIITDEIIAAYNQQSGVAAPLPATPAPATGATSRPAAPRPASTAPKSTPPKH
ncbi:MAG: OmpH family outer membrane protein [Terriglobales bacterium]